MQPACTQRSEGDLVSESPLSTSDFSVCVEYHDTQVIVRVRGDVDAVATPELTGILAAVTDHDDRALVVDVAEVGLFDPPALAVLTHAARRLEEGGGSLTVSSPSAALGRVLALAGLTSHMGPAGSDDQADLGREQTAAAPGSPVTSAPQLSNQLRRITSVPADDDVVDGALRLVVALATATVAGADGVSVSLRRHGRLSTVASSDQTIYDMDTDQYATGEGPCVDASVEGRWFHVDSLSTETRWPAFTPRAQALGISAILSSPLLVRERPVGALNIYSRRTGAFHPKDQDLAAVFATEASAILADAGVDVTKEQMAQRMTDALWTRQVIAQAQGVIMATDSVDATAAYARLREFSAATGTPLATPAAAVGAAAVPGGAAAGGKPAGGSHDR